MMRQLRGQHGPLSLFQPDLARGSGFSLEAPEGVRFLIRSRLLTEQELAELSS